jgi:hypothetical protein
VSALVCAKQGKKEKRRKEKAMIRKLDDLMM